MIDPDDLAPWAGAVEVRGAPSAGSRSDVVIVAIDSAPAIARRSRRSEESLDWELDLVEYLSTYGFVVPLPIRAADGNRRVGQVTVSTWIEGIPPTSADDWLRVSVALRRLHDVTIDWPQRPGYVSAADLLTVDCGGDIDLTAMPAAAVALCRAAWAALPAERRSHVVHGDPGAANLRITSAGVGFLDWDESRVDHAWFDLADLPVRTLDACQAELAERAADAWETANGWQIEPDYAQRRLRRLTARCSSSAT